MVAEEVKKPDAVKKRHLKREVVGLGITYQPQSM